MQPININAPSKRDDLDNFDEHSDKCCDLQRNSWNWFDDLKFTPAGIVVRKTGRIIGSNDLTLGEVGKFLCYLGVVLMQGAKARITGDNSLSICFVPDKPRPWYIVWTALTLSGARCVCKEQDADVLFYFEDLTVGVSPSSKKQVINGKCIDISKSTISSIFEMVAGYPLAVNPMQSTEIVVEKSEHNGAHDGRLIQCPTGPRDGKCYQKFVDCSVDGTAFDFRTTIIDRKPIFVLVKSKPEKERFSIHNSTVRYFEIGEVFSAREITLIKDFAKAMELDWAAIDILRDPADNRIYIVDVNKTDTGPAVDLSRHDRERLKSALTPAFKGLIVKYCNASNSE